MEGRPDVVDEVERSMLAALGARHARSAWAYGRAAAALVAVGLALAVLGWLLPERHGFAVMSVLADEWAELERTGDDPEATRRELRLFLRRLYDKKAAGRSDVQ